MQIDALCTYIFYEIIGFEGTVLKTCPVHDIIYWAFNINISEKNDLKFEAA